MTPQRRVQCSVSAKFEREMTMAKKCWIVSVELEVMVFAETVEDAKRLAKDDIRDEGRYLSEVDLQAAPATHVPVGYDLDWEIGAKGEAITVADALAKTPEYVAAQELDDRRTKKIEKARVMKKLAAVPSPVPESGKAASP